MEGSGNQGSAGVGAGPPAQHLRLFRLHQDPLREQAGFLPHPQVQPLKSRWGAAQAHPAEQV